MLKHDVVYYERDIAPLLTQKQRDFEQEYTRSNQHLGWVADKKRTTPHISMSAIINNRAQEMTIGGMSWGLIHSDLRGAF